MAHNCIESIKRRGKNTRREKKRKVEIESMYQVSVARSPEKKAFKNTQTHSRIHNKYSFSHLYLFLSLRLFSESVCLSFALVADLCLFSSHFCLLIDQFFRRLITTAGGFIFKLKNNKKRWTIRHSHSHSHIHRPTVVCRQTSLHRLMRFNKIYLEETRVAKNENKNKSKRTFDQRFWF